ncbi:MAG: hypothetical protein IK010_01295 [Bacteroidales bacterium]|nr:hypothetical protein [Bacteroidales bacterium]
MEHKMTFDDLWEQEERQALAKRLLHEYPAWKRHRARRRTLVAVAVLAVAALPILLRTEPHGYDSVCCNRSTFPESHWVDVSAAILTIPTI